MRKIIFIITILALLSACSGGADAIVITPNPSAPANDSFVNTSCATIYTAPPDTLKLKGFAVLDDYKATSHLFLKNLETGGETELATPDDTVSDIKISLDHKSAAYQLGNPKTNEWSVVVANAQGKRTAEDVWPKGFFTLGNWVNDDQILLQTFPPFVAFNPYTKQEKSFDYPDFPNYSLNTQSNRIIAFDPSLERAVYKNTNDKVSLYDIPNKKVLGEVDNHPNPSMDASWAPDGSQVAVVGTITLASKLADHSQDLFSMTRDGQVKRLTHLTDHYGRLVQFSKAGLSWSPDSRSIAFWMIYPQNEYNDWELGVYDLTTNKTTNYCISNDYENALNSTHYLSAPAWSPDGKQLMVENRYDKTSSRVLIVDLASKVAYQIEENKFPAGWIIP